MTVSQLPSKRWRARVWYGGRDIPVDQILGLPKGTTFERKRDATAAVAKAREILAGGRSGTATTVVAWWERWTTDPVFSRPKESTNIHNREGTKAFVAKYGDLPLDRITRAIVGEWRAGAKHESTIAPLRAMWNDAIREELTDRNPFASLGITRSRGNKDVQPPSEETVWDLIHAARRLAGPSFSAWLQVAAFTGMRPGELDALRWDAVDFDRSRILVAEQYSATSRTFTLPKNGKRRWAPLTPPARDALVGIAREAEFCFINLRRQHWTSSGRIYHWKAARAAVGFNGTLYVATRHFAGSWMTNVLGLAAEDVAIALGHEDGGALVRSTYGHRDKDMALDRVLHAFESRGNVIPLPKREETA